MVLSKVREMLFARRDSEYARFIIKLTPGLDEKTVIGVRSPDLKEIYKALDGDERSEFIRALPHGFYEENNLHSLIISHMKDEEECIAALDRFLPYIDNWATCDTVSPAVFKRHKDLLTRKTEEWIKSDRVYTVRMAVGLLMKYYLDGDFSVRYNDMVKNVVSDQYYVNMMCAWYFATALAKQYESTVPYLPCLNDTVRKMTVRKASESYRISPERKEYIKSFK